MGSKLIFVKSCLFRQNIFLFITLLCVLWSWTRRSSMPSVQLKSSTMWVSHPPSLSSPGDATLSQKLLQRYRLRPLASQPRRWSQHCDEIWGKRLYYINISNPDTKTKKHDGIFPGRRRAESEKKRHRQIDRHSLNICYQITSLLYQNFQFQHKQQNNYGRPRTW